MGIYKGNYLCMQQAKENVERNASNLTGVAEEGDCRLEAGHQGEGRRHGPHGVPGKDVLFGGPLPLVPLPEEHPDEDGCGQEYGEEHIVAWGELVRQSFPVGQLQCWSECGGEFGAAILG